jgi:hypothetical protein
LVCLFFCVSWLISSMFLKLPLDKSLKFLF